MYYVLMKRLDQPFHNFRGKGADDTEEEEDADDDGEEESEAGDGDHEDPQEDAEEDHDSHPGPYFCDFNNNKIDGRRLEISTSQCLFFCNVFV